MTQEDLIMEFKRVFERIFRFGTKIVRHRDMPMFTLKKLRLASHPDASPATLKKLSSHKCESVVIRVAENCNTAAEVLESLALHPLTDVRIALAENSNTPIRIVLNLALDESVDVRFSLAENHNVPLAVLRVLCEDENPYVACRARKTMERLDWRRANSLTSFPAFDKDRRHKELG